MRTVREVDVPPGVFVLADLQPVGYREAWDFPAVAERSPEQWARVILEGASARERQTMLTAWTLLGIRLAPRDAPGQVLGWRIRHSSADGVVLEARSPVGLTARIVVGAYDGRVTHAMVVRTDNAVARALWRRVAPGHRRFVAGLLRRAAT